MPTRPEPWLGLSDAARLAGVSQAAIYKAALTGRLTSKIERKRRWFSRASVERYAAKRAARAATSAGLQQYINPAIGNGQLPELD